MAQVATIQSASGTAATSAKGSAQSADTGFMAALDAILQADGAVIQANAATPAQPAAQPATKDDASDAADADIDENSTDGVSGKETAESDAAVAQPAADAPAVAQAPLTTAKAGTATPVAIDQVKPGAPSPAATVTPVAVMQVQPSQGKAKSETTTAAAIPTAVTLKRPTSLVFAQAGTIDPASEIETPEPTAPAELASPKQDAPAAVATAVVALPTAPVSTAAASAKPVDAVAPELAVTPSVPATATPTSKNTAVAAPAGKASRPADVQPQVIAAASAQPTPDVVAVAAATATLAPAPANVAEPEAAGASDRSIEATGPGASRPAASGKAEPQPQTAAAMSAAAPAQPQAAATKTTALPDDADNDQAAPLAALPIQAKAGSAKAADPADQPVEAAGTAQDQAVLPVQKPGQAADVNLADASGKSRPVANAAPAAAATHTSGAATASAIAGTVTTAPVTNTQEAAKLVLNGVAGQSPVDQVSVAVHTAVVDKASSVTIALNPAELGKVEVKLDFSRDGSVQASIIAERPDTLQILRNDHQALHQALNNAGLSTDSSSLNFSLGSDRQNQQASQGNNTPYASRTTFAAETVAETPAASAPTQSVAADGRVDMFV